MSAIGFVANNRIASGLRTSDEVKYEQHFCQYKSRKAANFMYCPLVGRIRRLSAADFPAADCWPERRTPWRFECDS
jgi:hypothetical protein